MSSQGYQYVGQENDSGSDDEEIKHHDGHGHSNGHSHDHHGHGHDHHGHDHHGHDHHGHEAGRKGKKPKWFDKYNVQIKIFAYEYSTAGWVLTVFWYNKSLQDTNPLEYWVGNIFVTLAVFMTHFSYFRCSTAESYVKERKQPAWETQHKGECKSCSYWKPDRVHHCSACGECVMKMDHHCPWICRCVGYTNHKAFWLYVFYISMASIYHDWRMIQWFGEEYSSGELFRHSFLFYVYLIMHVPIIFMVSLMTSGLCFFHFRLAMNNLTTLEQMGGGNMRSCFDSQREIESKMVNTYDKGLLANLCEFFNNDPLWWWYPDIRKFKHPAFYFIQMPKPSPTDVVGFLRQGREDEVSEEERKTKPGSLAEVDVEQFLKYAENYTADKHIQFANQMFEVGKRDDNTKGESNEAPQPNPQQQMMQQQMMMQQMMQRQLQQQHQQQQQAQEGEQKPNAEEEELIKFQAELQEQAQKVMQMRNELLSQHHQNSQSGTQDPNLQEKQAALQKEMMKLNDMKQEFMKKQYGEEGPTIDQQQAAIQQQLMMMMQAQQQQGSSIPPEQQAAMQQQMAMMQMRLQQLQQLKLQQQSVPNAKPKEETQKPESPSKTENNNSPNKESSSSKKRVYQGLDDDDEEEISFSNTTLKKKEEPKATSPKTQEETTSPVIATTTKEEEQEEPSNLVSEEPQAQEEVLDAEPEEASPEKKQQEVAVTEDKEDDVKPEEEVAKQDGEGEGQEAQE